MAHALEELVKGGLPEASGDVVAVRKGVKRGGKTRIEGHLEERVVSVGESVMRRYQRSRGRCANRRVLTACDPSRA